jgi:hypothetical protein
MPKMISMPVLHSTQTVHLSCAEIKTISKWIELSFHLTYVTKEYPRVCPKRFQSLWYIWWKLCTYIASRLTLSPNRLKRASTWPTTPRSTIGVPKQFQSLWYIWRKPYTYLASRLILSPNRPKRASIWPTSPRSTIRCAQNDFHGHGTFDTKRAPISCLD